jgi:hypothetical protein
MNERSQVNWTIQGSNGIRQDTNKLPRAATIIATMATPPVSGNYNKATTTTTTTTTIVAVVMTVVTAIWEKQWRQSFTTKNRTFSVPKMDTTYTVQITANPTYRVPAHTISQQLWEEIMVTTPTDILITLLQITLLLGHVPPHGGVLAAQHQLKKFNTYQPLIEVRIQRLRCLLERYKEENSSHFGGCVCD